MTPADYAARQIVGVLKMVFGDPDWRESLGRSLDDVFNSFWSIPAAAPFVVLAALSTKRAANRIPELAELAVLDAPIGALVGVEIAAFVLQWAAGLVILVMVARGGGAGRGAADLIIGYNWVQLLTVIAGVPAVAIMSASGNVGLGGLFAAPALAFSLALHWGVIRRALRASASVAVAIISMLIVVGLFIDWSAATLLAGFFGDYE